MTVIFENFDEECRLPLMRIEDDIDTTYNSAYKIICELTNPSKLTRLVRTFNTLDMPASKIPLVGEVFKDLNGRNWKVVQHKNSDFGYVITCVEFAYDSNLRFKKLEEYNIGDIFKRLDGTRKDGMWEIIDKNKLSDGTTVYKLNHLSILNCTRLTSDYCINMYFDKLFL